MAGGSYFEVEARVVAPGVVARIAALIEPAAQDIERRLQEAIRNGLNGSGIRPGVQGSRTGQQFGDAFGRTAKTRIEAALRSLPTVQIGVATTEAEQRMRDLSARLKRLNEDIELGVDDGKALADLDVLRRELREIARTSPDVRVRVNVGTALAELEALKRSLDGFDRGGLFTRLRIGAGNWLDGLSDKLRTTFPALDGVANRLSDVATKVQGLGDEATAGAKSNPFAGLASTNVLLVAIAAALTTVGPLVAAATAGVLGLAGAAGVALLAFKGLQAQMAIRGTVGAYIGEQLNTVSAQLRGLSEVAAQAVGPAVRDVLTVTSLVAPTLKGLVSVVGGQLGGIARALGTALLTAVQRAAPLITLIVGYFQRGAEALQRWVLGPGFEEFLGYAIREFPIVVNLVKSVGSALISGFVAFAPVGEIVLRVLTAIFTVLGGIADAAGSVIGFIGGLFGGNGSAPDQGKAAAGQLASIQSMLTALGTLGAAQDDNALKSSGVARAFGVTNGAYAAAAASAKQTADQLAQTTLQMQLQNDAAGLLKQSLDALSGKNLGVAQSLSSFQQGLLGIDDTFTKAKFSSTAFTDTAVAQRTALEGLVQQAQAHAEAVGTQTNSTAAATAALQADYAQILDNTGATGANRQAILDYITSIGAIPPVAPTQIDVNTAEATARVNAFRVMYQNLPPGTVTIGANLDSASAAVQRFISTPRTAYVQVQTVTGGPNGGVSGGKAVLEARGGILRGQTQMFADGGVITAEMASKLSAASVPAYADGALMPQITMVPRAIFGEAGPESYIPLADDYRRPRALQIWAKTGQELGAFGSQSTTSTAATSAALVAQVAALRSDVQQIPGAVLAGASHVADRNDGALARHSADAALRGAAIPRQGF